MALKLFVGSMAATRRISGSIQFEHSAGWCYAETAAIARDRFLSEAVEVLWPQHEEWADHDVTVLLVENVMVVQLDTNTGGGNPCRRAN